MRVHYKAIDILRLFMSVFIVMIHTYVFELLPGMQGWFFRHFLLDTAIPIFFVISGFFWGRKMVDAGDNEKREQVLKNYIKKLMPPFLFWNLCGLAYYAHSIWDSKSKLYIMADVLRRAVFYPTFAMWFVWACIIASTIIFFIMKKFKKYRTVIYIYMIIAYTFSLVCNSYFWVIKDTKLGTLVEIYLKVFISPRNGILSGFVFMAIGFLLADLRLEMWVKKRMKSTMLLLIASAFTLGLEVALVYGKEVGDNASLYISQLILVPVIILIVLNLNLKSNLPYAAFRNYSQGIYYCHMACVYIVQIFIENKVLVLLFTLALATCLVTISLNSKNKWIKMVI